MFDEYTSISGEEAPQYCVGSENQLIRDVIKEYVEDRDVIEIGCGIGIDAHRYNPEQYTGVDISPELINVAKTNNPEHRFICGNFIDMPIRRYNVSFTKSVLEHTPNEDVFISIVDKMISISDMTILAFHTPPIWDTTEIIQCKGHFGKTIYQNHYRRSIFDHLQLKKKTIKVDNFTAYIFTKD